MCVRVHECVFYLFFRSQSRSGQHLMLQNNIETKKRASAASDAPSVLALAHLRVPQKAGEPCNVPRNPRCVGVESYVTLLSCVHVDIKCACECVCVSAHVCMWLVHSIS